MNSDELSNDRLIYNKKLFQTDSFFQQFANLDDSTYCDGAIDKKHKELMGLAISIVTKCNECICYHIETSLNAKASYAEIIDAIKIGVMAGGSVTFPNARFAIKTLEEFSTK